MAVNQITINHTLKLIRLTKIAGMDTKLFVVTTISTVNQCRSIEVRMLFTNLWRKC